MSEHPVFPNFKQLALADREALHSRIWAFQPDTSELTFGNLYIWRTYYNFEWSLMDDTLVILANERDGGHFALPPVGSGPRKEATYDLLTWLRDERDLETPAISRVDERLVEELRDDDRFAIRELRDHFDYVYQTTDLSELPGRKYSAKRNHINQFSRYYSFEYQPVTPELAPECLALAEIWCEQRLCEEDLSLQHELSGIEDMLNNVETLEVDGGAILIYDKVQAFALGEKLNESTAVVHIEKANPEFKGIYTQMTQAYAERWAEVTTFINLEQDLGEPGLRRAKDSYYPDHMAKKYEITLA
jgi:uncharacterized protein